MNGKGGEEDSCKKKVFAEFFLVPHFLLL